MEAIMGEIIPSSSSSLRNAAGCGEMVRVVVKRQGNGVDRLKLIEKVPRPATFPANARLLDMDDVRVRDLVTLGFERAGVDLPTDAVVTGCAYEVGDETHKCAWICEVDADASTGPVVSRVIEWIRSNRAARRTVLALLLAAAYIFPSPFEWGEVLATAAPMVRIMSGGTICAAQADTVPEACMIAGPLCGADATGQ
ncbi:hypothetical protein [Burkholderia phage CSP3]|nr:hypothetical protein [Burkholderia phage CSP3]